jgi:uncharacterized protein DUF4157
MKAFLIRSAGPSNGSRATTGGLALQRKCTCGCSAGKDKESAECGSKRLTGLQAKLAVNSPGDRYEEEADRLSVEVMRRPAPEQPGPPGRRPAPLQRHAQSPAEPAADAQGAAPEIVEEVLHSPGQLLDRSTRAFMEPRLDFDFSKVRIHTGARAAESARSVHALAYAVGQDIVFGEGQYAPDSDRGRQLLAHELTHVAQQTQVDGSPWAPPRVQRYLYDETCSADDRSTIMGGHRLAQWATGRASNLLAEKDPPTGGLKGWFDFLFGSDAEKQRKQIAANFGTLKASLQEDYNYICPTEGTSPCIGPQAEVTDGQNVNVCMGRLKSFSQAGMARLLVHENVRRAHGRRSVFNINDASGECTGAGTGNPYYQEATTDSNHPVPYSCFAEKMITVHLAEKKKETDALFQSLMGSGAGPTSWNGTLAIDNTDASVWVSLHVRLIDLDFVVSGNYGYEHPQRGKGQGEIPFGIIRFSGPPGGDNEALSISFDWSEGTATGRGIWRSDGADALKGTWGRGDSSSDGGSWKLRKGGS